MQQEPMISVRNVLWDIDDIFMGAGEVDVQDGLEMLHDSLMKIMGEAYIDILVRAEAPKQKRGRGRPKKGAS